MKKISGYLIAIALLMIIIILFLFGKVGWLFAGIIIGMIVMLSIGYVIDVKRNG